VRTHARELVVAEMKSRLVTALHHVLYDKEAALTPGETLRIVADVFGDWLSSRAKYEIRQERHPDNPEKPGGLA
jgi:hypothetical protein